MFDYSIILYLFSFNSLRPNTQILSSHLTHQEIKEAYSYKTKQLQENYIITRAILRQTLSWYTCIPSSEIIFIKAQHNKPYISKPQNHNNIHFNISYSKDLLCIAISKSPEIGVDIEFENQNINVEEIQNLVLSATEKKFIHALDSSALKQKFFYTIWTLKEAIIKALGFGLYYPITQIDLIDIDSTNKFNIKDKITIETLEEILVLYIQNLNNVNLSVSLTNLNNYSLSVATKFKTDEIIYRTTL